MSIDRRDVFSIAALAGGIALSAPARAAVAARGARSDRKRTGELDCARVVMRFFDRLDALNRLRGATRAGNPSAPTSETEDPWSLMTEDGSWRRNAGTIESRAAWEKAIGDLPAGLITAHLVCNLIIEEKSETLAAASFRLLIFSATSEHGVIPVKLGAPGAILWTNADLSRVNGEWRIKKMGSDALFHF